MRDPAYAAFSALDPFFEIVRQGLAGLVDGDHYFDTIAPDAVFEFRYRFPGYPTKVVGRDALMALYAGYGEGMALHGADALVVNISQTPGIVILEYEVQGNAVGSGKLYENRFISVVTIEDRKIVGWRDYMDSLAAMSSLTQWIAFSVRSFIQNELYAGRLVWNKVRMVKDPDTGKRLSRPNPKDDWQTANVPDLRIISKELFDAAQSRKLARGHTHPNQQRRPRHMLSGLLRCGACGAGMSTNGKDNSGRIRIRCSAATESGSCKDAKTFYLKAVESAVLAGLENEMRHPQVIAEYVRTYHEERKRLSAKANAKRAHLELRLGELNREIDRLVDAIAKGHGNPTVLGPRSSVLNEERKQVAMDLNVEPAVNDTISLHPAVLARYEQQLVQLQDALSKGINSGDSEAAQAIRDLVETVTVFRDHSRSGGLTIEIVGRLNALLGEQAYPNKVRGVW